MMGVLLTGELSAGQIVVDGDKADVVLVLNGVNITAANISAINVVNADWVVLALAEGTTNTVSEAADAVASEDAETNGAIYSTADLWITGKGTLDVTGVAADGIVSKDTLVVESGTVHVTAKDDGIRGKDHLVVLGGNITVDAQGDGLKSNNVSDTDDASYPVGVVWISGGTLDVTAGSDTIDAENQVTVEDGTLALQAGDDGITTNGIMRVTGGTINVKKSVEGFEAAIMHLDGGTGTIVSSDDGINATDGSTSSNQNAGVPNMGTPPEDGSFPGGGERPARPGDDTTGNDNTDTSDTGTIETNSTTTQTVTVANQTASNDDQTDNGQTTDGQTRTRQNRGGGGPNDQATEGVLVDITGGTWSINAGGDGLDSNGDVIITDGTVIVSGPTSNGNGALDYNGTFEMNGGTLVAAGSAGMAQSPSSSKQGVLAVSYGQTVSAGTSVALVDDEGNLVAAYTAPKDAQTLVFSSPNIKQGETYTVYTGADVTGTEVAGLVTSGSVTGGSKAGTVTATQS